MSGRLSIIKRWDLLAVKADFRSNKMAALCSVSPRHLQRFFGEQFQKSPRIWLRELQCEFARQLISQGYSNKAAASELKFSNENHFCREFKRFFGHSPQKFFRVAGQNSEKCRF
jgi:AraC-like DNA-binding protein